MAGPSYYNPINPAPLGTPGTGAKATGADTGLPGSDTTSYNDTRAGAAATAGNPADSANRTGAQTGGFAVGLTPGDSSQWAPQYSGDGGTTGFNYADVNAYTDPNQSNIFNLIKQGFNNTNRGAPVANGVNLGAANTQGGAAIAPQMMVSGAGLNTAGSNQFIGGQGALANMLNQTAQGAGPNLAGYQAQVAAQQNALSAMGVLASSGGNPALAARAAANTQATANQAAADTAAQSALQQQVQAQGQLGQVLASGTSGAQAQAATQAQMQQQAALANQQAFSGASTAQGQLSQAQIQANQEAINQQMLQQGQLSQGTNLANLTSAGQQNQLNSQMYNSMLQAYQGQNQTDISNLVAYQQEMGNEQLGEQQLMANMAINQANNSTGLAGAGISGLGALAGLAALSDMRAKTKIMGADPMIRSFLDSLSTRSLNA